MTDSETLIPLGKITGTHGIRGFLKFHSFSGAVDSLRVGVTVTLKSGEGTLSRLELASVLNHAGKFMISFSGLDDINQVKMLVGSEICLLRSQLPEPEEDEYYWCDLVGLRVATTGGRDLGVIEEIFEAGSSDIYVVRGKDREYMIPAIADVISSVDMKKGLMLVSPLEGLLDL